MSHNYVSIVLNTLFFLLFCMVKCKFYVRQTENLVSEEIDSIMHTLYGENKNELKNDAETIAKSYLKINGLTDPITLARSSFYIAMKKVDEDPTSKIKVIKNNNGKKNKWWIHLVPIMENQLKRV